MRLLLPSLLVGCAHPITNLPFYEDAAFIASLPSGSRFDAPEQVRVARVGDATLLGEAVAASAELQDHVETLVRSGEALRGADPTERTDLSRGWDPIRVATDLGGERFTWWVRGDVVRASQGSDLSWSISVSAKEVGPWAVVGDGRHDPSGYGDARWDLAAMVEVIVDQASEEPSSPLGELSIDYEDGSDGAVREVSIAHAVGADPIATWTSAGDVAIGWFGVSGLTEPPLAGSFQVLHGDIGGWAVGELYDGDTTLDVVTCWNAAGDALYSAGTLHDDPRARFPAVGVEGDCTTPYPF